MRILLLILTVLSGLAQAQDTTRIEPIAEVEGFKIFDITGNDVIVQYFEGNEWFLTEREIIIYDFSTPDEPEMVDRSLYMELDEGHFESGGVRDHGGAIFFDPLFLTTINIADYWGGASNGHRIGPLEFIGMSTDQDDSIWIETIVDELLEVENFNRGDLVDHPLMGDIARFNNYVFVAAGAWGIRIYDLSDPFAPQLTDTLGYECERLSIWDERLVFFDIDEETEHLVVADLSDLESIRITGEIELSSINPTSGKENLEFLDRYLFRSTYVWSEGESPEIVIYDVFADDSPVEVERFDSLIENRGMVIFTISNDQLFVKNNTYLDVYNLTEPLEPEYLYAFEVDTGDFNQIEVEGDLLFMAQGSGIESNGSTILVYDISPVSVPLEKGLNPREFSIFCSYPNPFNSTATITYGLPFPGNIALQLYNPFGQRISTLFEGNRQAGIFKANLVGKDLTSGLYFVRLEGSGQVFTQKVMLVR